jgi:hypothetical protein
VYFLLSAILAGAWLRRVTGSVDTTGPAGARPDVVPGVVVTTVVASLVPGAPTIGARPRMWDASDGLRDEQLRRNHDTDPV